MSLLFLWDTLTPWDSPDVPLDLMGRLDVPLTFKDSLLVPLDPLGPSRRLHFLTTGHLDLWIKIKY